MATAGNSRNGNRIYAPAAIPARTQKERGIAAPARKPRRKETIGDRVLHTSVITALLFVLLFGRLFYLQITRHPEFVEKASKMREKSLSLAARRGAILDRNGGTLARDEPAWDIAVDPNVWFEPGSGKLKDETPQARQERVMSRLCAFLPDVEVAAIFAKKGMVKGKSGRYRTVPIAEKVSSELGDAIESANLIGVSVRGTTRRVAVSGEFAPHIMGFTGRDGKGLDGLENGLNESLSGESGKIEAEFDKWQRPIPGTVRTNLPAQHGRDVVLTLDPKLQSVVQDSLGKAFVARKAESATAIVLDPKTGDILALANYPTYDVNKRSKSPAEARNNRAATSPFEPGSTLKIITVAAALQEGLVNPDSYFVCSGTHRIGNKAIHCHVDGGAVGHGGETLRDVIRSSCNIATAECAFRLGKSKLYDYEKAFGFGDRTRAGLPGESPGILDPHAKWSDMTLANISFGQGISVTALQLAAAYGAIANDGVYQQPRIVWGTRVDGDENNGEGAAMLPAKQPEGRRVISSRTARQLREMLQGVVDNGTGRIAQLEGYTAGGKTGTAQVAVNGSYKNRKFVASFVGMAPAKNPQFVILVSVTDPKDKHFGSEVSAPVFKEIAERALLAYRVPHDKARSGKKRVRPVVAAD